MQKVLRCKKSNDKRVRRLLSLLTNSVVSMVILRAITRETGASKMSAVGECAVLKLSAQRFRKPTLGHNFRSAHLLQNECDSWKLSGENPSDR